MKNLKNELINAYNQEKKYLYDKINNMTDLNNIKFDYYTQRIKDIDNNLLNL